MVFNRIPTSSMPNVHLIRHNNKPDEHLLRAELSLNIFDYSDRPKRMSMVRISKKLIKLFLRRKTKRSSRQYYCVYDTRYYHSYG